MFVLLAFAGAAKARGEVSPRTGEKVVLQLRWKHQFQFAGYYAAVVKGYYADAGLDVQIEEGGVQRNTIDEVLSGRAQFGVSNSEILLHRLRHKPLVVLAAIFQHSPLVLVSRQEMHVDSPQSLIGKRVRIMKNSRDIEIHAMLMNEGVSLDELQILPGPREAKDYFDPDVYAFSAYITNQPYYYEQAGVNYSVMSPRTYGIDFYGDCLFTSEQEIENHSQRVEAFRKASLKGWEYAMKHKAEMIGIIRNQYHSQKSLKHLQFEAREMQQLILPELVEMGHMNPGRWQHIAKTFERFGLVRPGYSLDGFIYQPDSQSYYSRYLRIILVILVISLLITIAALLLLWFNRRLHREIRDRERMEKAIIRERDFVTAVLRWVDSIVVVIDFDGYIVSFNRAAEISSGYSLEEVSRKPFWEILVPENERDRIRNIWQTMKADHTANAGRNHWVKKNGEMLLIDWSNSFLTGPDGDVEYVLSTGRDQTEQSQVEDALKRREEHYQYILENLEEGYFEVDLRGTITVANKSFLKTMGYSRSELVGMNHREFMDEKTAAEVYQIYNRIYRTGKSDSYPVYDVIRKNGERRTIEASVSLQYDEDNNPIGFHGITRDITERKHMEAMMIQTEKMMSVGGLAAGMAHEINNPLAIIVQGIQNINRRIDPDLKANLKAANEAGISLAALRSYLAARGINRMTDSIQVAARRAADIIQNMLRFSRKSDFVLSYIDIETFIERTLDLAYKDYDLLKKYDFRHITIDLQIAEGLPGVSCMEQEIEQVLLNLLVNAAQAMQEADPPTSDPKITIRARTEGEMMRLEVEDNGPGIPEAVKKRIFEPFYTTKPTGVGTGLGLSVSYMIVTNNHNGTLEVDSEIGRGTCFIIRLPLSQENAGKVKTPVGESASS